MLRETINRIEILESGEFFLGIEGSGSASYQYIYREAAGIYWDPERNGFKSTKMQNWPCSQWFNHIVSVTHSGLGVELKLATNIEWSNIPESEMVKITNAKAI